MTTDFRIFPVCCLACGSVRMVRKTTASLLESPSCAECGYVGWREAEPDDLARRPEPVRHLRPAPVA